jgi:hypothetical protein
LTNGALPANFLASNAQENDMTDWQFRNFLKAMVYPALVTLFVVIALVARLLGVSAGASALIWQLGLLASAVGMLGYIIFLDSSKRWPSLTWTQRAKKVFTYQR